ncbi:thioesterase family protein [Marinilabiliaceae bacterium ANBcel2]|nr:thioesterase family protein [Marinilabiliaceae bacterium ANBcel2]
MIENVITIRPRYCEVDKMGYVYHGNYVSYCHQARTELFRRYAIDDSALEKEGIMLPVISMQLHYHSPANYDNPLNVKVLLEKIPSTRAKFKFEITDGDNTLVCTASTTVTFVDSKTRKPIRPPHIVTEALKPYF